MICWIYRSPIKTGTYLYCAKKDDFSDVPEALLKAFGKPDYAMHLNLDARTSLAREDIDKVRTNLKEQHFHLQVPPPLIDLMKTEL
jgi:uncharacterized protein